MCAEWILNNRNSYEYIMFRTYMQYWWKLCGIFSLYQFDFVEKLCRVRCGMNITRLTGITFICILRKSNIWTCGWWGVVGGFGNTLTYMNNISLPAAYLPNLLLPRPLLPPSSWNDPLISQSAFDRNALSDCFVNGICGQISRNHHIRVYTDRKAQIQNNLIIQGKVDDCGGSLFECIWYRG